MQLWKFGAKNSHYSSTLSAVCMSSKDLELNIMPYNVLLVDVIMKLLLYLSFNQRLECKLHYKYSTICEPNAINRLIRHSFDL